MTNTTQKFTYTYSDGAQQVRTFTTSPNGLTTMTTTGVMPGVQHNYTRAHVAQIIRDLLARGFVCQG